jgi:hypothetical protein
LGGYFRLYCRYAPTISLKLCANDFIAIRDGVIAARASAAADEDWKRLAEDYLKLYTKAARLDGSLQDVIGGLPSD